jgi:pSer/pThr/pTyr-binding forkhead associated (FHA) protein
MTEPRGRLQFQLPPFEAILLGPRPILIGTHRSCDVRLEHPSLVRRHAEIRCAEAAHWVHALHGDVVVGGHDVATHRLRNGDDFWCGEVRFSYYVA